MNPDTLEVDRQTLFSAFSQIQDKIMAGWPEQITSVQKFNIMAIASIAASELLSVHGVRVGWQDFMQAYSGERLIDFGPIPESNSEEERIFSKIAGKSIFLPTYKKRGSTPLACLDALIAGEYVLNL